MHKAPISKILLTIFALSLSACSSGTGTGSGSVSTSGAGSADGGSHPVLIGPEDSKGPALKGSGKWAAIARDPKDFYAIDVRGPIKVTVTVGMPPAISIEADDNIAPAVDTRVEANKLIIEANKPFQAARAPEVVLSTPQLSEVSQSGSGEIIINGVRGDIFKLNVSGSGKFYANGKVGKETVITSGSGKIDCIKLTADNVTVEHSGSGDCNLNATKSLTAKLTGKGNIKYTGNPANLSKSDTGDGTISQLNI